MGFFSSLISLSCLMLSDYTACCICFSVFFFITIRWLSIHLIHFVTVFSINWSQNHTKKQNKLCTILSECVFQCLVSVTKRNNAIWFSHEMPSVFGFKPSTIPRPRIHTQLRVKSCIFIHFEFDGETKPKKIREYEKATILFLFNSQEK